MIIDESMCECLPFFVIADFSKTIRRMMNAIIASIPIKPPTTPLAIPALLMAVTN